MDAVHFLQELKRMCHNGYCPHCPLSKGLTTDCFAGLYERPEETVQLVEKWSVEHPQKTRLTEFLEKYPNAVFKPLTKIPETCCHNLGYTGDCIENCEVCWNQPLEEASDE